MAERMFTKGMRKRLLEAGYKRTTILAWDHKKARPKAEKVVRVSEITGIPVRTLLGIPIKQEGKDGEAA